MENTFTIKFRDGHYLVKDRVTGRYHVSGRHHQFTDKQIGNAKRYLSKHRRGWLMPYGDPSLIVRTITERVEAL